MAMLVAKSLSLSFGPKIILDDVSISLLPGERVALVGQNGTGKSTLLKILGKQLSPDDGGVESNSRLRIGVLTQEPQLNDDDTVIEAVRRGMAGLYANIREHSELCDALATCPDLAEAERLQKRIGHLARQIEMAGGFDIEHRVQEVLFRLHVRQGDQHIRNLSGGEKRRVDLARVMLSAPDVYLLDEPTNHLDIDSIRFLVDTFTSCTKPLLFISHDRAFIDDVATRILELVRGKIYGHDIPYANYLENKLIRTDIAARTLHRNERMVARELAWLRAGTPARTTKQNARISRAESLIDEVQKEVEASEQNRVNIGLAKTKRLAKTILELKSVGFAFGNRTLFDNVSLIVTSRDRYGVVGANGSGKTTLLSLIAGTKEPTSGTVVRGPHTEIAQFDQNRTQLDPELSLKETLAEQGDYVFIGQQRLHIASYLERFLFDASDMNRKVATLSGGEQNRLLLAKLFKKGANCLLLDEPTNDLDLSTLGVLEEAINNLEGVAFIVSHDRRFLDRVCTGIIAFEPTEESRGPQSRVVVYQGGYTTYERLRAKSTDEKEKLQVPDDKKDASIVLRKKQKRSFNEEREYLQIESDIQNLEAQREQMQQEMASGEIYRRDPQKAQDVSRGLGELEAQIEKLYERWQYLESLG